MNSHREKGAGMKKYRFWINSKEYVDIEAECPSKAIEKAEKECKRRRFWKIGKAR